MIRVESILHAFLFSCAAVAVHTVYYYQSAAKPRQIGS